MLFIIMGSSGFREEPKSRFLEEPSFWVPHETQVARFCSSFLPYTEQEASHRLHHPFEKIEFRICSALFFSVGCSSLFGCEFFKILNCRRPSPKLQLQFFAAKFWCCYGLEHWD
ncbi:hypothetical protein SLEP1_g15120 [Rubroshorea leprosula]|uniref:Uncharacterized protein n=1 Tax=Rubroshorea leprosula TaxID=152421 RepID=A0AAV5IY13_9ROSI|nr:hypothetical protein SLEP1_g15120 [Rubroshorea leprosula]